MKKKLNTLVFLGLTMFPLAGFADTPVFEDISKSDLETITKEFSSNFSFTSVSPASSLGEVFGLEIGIIGGASKVPGIEGIVRKAEPAAQVDYVPHGTILIAASFPMGLGLELNYLPSIDQSELKFENKAFAVRWSLTSGFIKKSSFDFALKVHMAESKLGFTQLVSNPVPTQTEVEFSSTTYGVMGLLSKEFLFFEPYLGMGWITVDGGLRVEASDGSGFFDPSFTIGNSAKLKDSGIQYFGGFNLNLFILRIGIEAGKIFDTTKYAAKMSVAF